MSYIKQNSLSLATTCKRLHVDKMNDASEGPFHVQIDLNKNPVLAILELLRLQVQGLEQSNILTPIQTIKNKHIAEL